MTLCSRSRHELPPYATELSRGVAVEQIADNVFVITENLGSNNGMVVTSEGIVLIDSPHKPTDAVAWRRQVEEKGRVRYLINTDHHIDHTMGNFFMADEATVIIGHDETRRKLLEAHPTLELMTTLLEHFDPAGLPLMENYIYRVPTLTCSDRMTLHLGGICFQLMFFQGHTPNGLMVYLPEQRILFSGDHVCTLGLPSFQECRVFEWFDTLNYIMSMDVDLIVPGHGDVGPRGVARTFYDEVRNLVERVRDAMKKGWTREKIVEEIRFPDLLHVTTDRYVGYPEQMMEQFQRRSMGAIYDQILARWGT